MKKYILLIVSALFISTSVTMEQSQVETEAERMQTLENMIAEMEKSWEVELGRPLTPEERLEVNQIFKPQNG